VHCTSDKRTAFQKHNQWWGNESNGGGGGESMVSLEGELGGRLRLGKNQKNAGRIDSGLVTLDDYEIRTSVCLGVYRKQVFDPLYLLHLPPPVFSSFTYST